MKQLCMMAKERLPKRWSHLQITSLAPFGIMSMTKIGTTTLTINLSMLWKLTLKLLHLLSSTPLMNLAMMAASMDGIGNGHFLR